MRRIDIPFQDTNWGRALLGHFPELTSQKSDFDALIAALQESEKSLVEAAAEVILENVSLQPKESPATIYDVYECGVQFAAQNCIHVEIRIAERNEKINESTFVISFMLSKDTEIFHNTHAAVILSTLISISGNPLFPISVGSDQFAETTTETTAIAALRFAGALME